MRILLTGASGLIGSAVRQRLAAEHEIVTLGRRAGADVIADLSAPESLREIQIDRVDALVHCAGVVDEDFVDSPERGFRAATLGADALVDAAIEAGARRLVYVSSAHVYGPMVGRKDESSPPDPRSNYAISHYATEQVFHRRVSDSVSGLALRPCAVFGTLADPAGFRRWSLIPFSFPRDAIRDGSIVIRSTGEQRRNFVGTEDIAATAARWLAQESAGWSAINPIGKHSMTVFEFAELSAAAAEEICGTQVTVSRQAPEAPTAGDDFEYLSVFPDATGGQDLGLTMRELMRDLLRMA